MPIMSKEARRRSPEGRLHYAGAVGTGFSDKELLALRAGLEPLRLVQPPSLLVAGDPPDRNIRWIAPNLAAEVEFAGWSGEGRVRHPVFLGLREDQAVSEVVMQVPDPEVRRREFRPVRVVRLVERSVAGRGGEERCRRFGRSDPYLSRADKAPRGRHLIHFWARPCATKATPTAEAASSTCRESAGLSGPPDQALRQEG
jgi:ATP dependent DNA ligase C terminal region